MCWADSLAIDFSPAAVALLALGAVVAILLMVPLAMRLLGPLFALELSRAARSGRLNILRVAYAAAILIALFVTFPSQSTLSRTELQQFAERFSSLFLMIQSIAALVMTPIVFGSAIASEKENGSLDFLLVTPLSATEIVLGKYFGWFLNVAGVLLTGLPILALTIFWGGVDLEKAVVILAADAIAMLSVGAIGMLCSVIFRRRVPAIACAAAVVLSGSLFCGGASISPISVQRTIEAPERNPATSPVLTPPWRLLGFYAIQHGVTAVLFLTLAVVCLRRWAKPPGAPSPAFVGRLAFPIPLPPLDVPGRYPILLPESHRGDALIWRERHLGYLSDPYFITFWLYFAGLLVLLTLASLSLIDEVVEQSIRFTFRAAVAGCFGGFCLILLARLAGCISREREQRTLELLLSLPVSIGRIVYAKWVGTVLRSNRWAIAAISGLALGTVTGAFGITDALLLLLLGFSWAAFVSATALCASVFARTTVRAYIYAIVAVLGVAAAATFNAEMRPGTLEKQDSYVRLTEDALSPYHAWRMSSKIQPDNRLTKSPVLPMLSAALVYFTAAGVIAAATFWRFHREDRYT